MRILVQLRTSLPFRSFPSTFAWAELAEERLFTECALLSGHGFQGSAWGEGCVFNLGDALHIASVQLYTFMKCLAARISYTHLSAAVSIHSVQYFSLGQSKPPPREVRYIHECPTDVMSCCSNLVVWPPLQACQCMPSISVSSPSKVWPLFVSSRHNQSRVIYSGSLLLLVLQLIAATDALLMLSREVEVVAVVYIQCPWQGLLATVAGGRDLLISGNKNILLNIWLLGQLTEAELCEYLTGGTNSSFVCALKKYLWST